MDEKPVCAVNFDSVKPGFYRSSRRLAERMDKVLNFLLRQRPRHRCIRLIRSDGAGADRPLYTFGSRMEELEDCFCSVFL